MKTAGANWAESPVIESSTCPSTTSIFIFAGGSRSEIEHPGRAALDPTEETIL